MFSCWKESGHRNVPEMAHFSGGRRPCTETRHFGHVSVVKGGHTPKMCHFGCVFGARGGGGDGQTPKTRPYGHVVGVQGGETRKT